MIILGLGSNVGDRLNNLRSAYSELKKINGLTIKLVSPVYTSDALLPNNAPADWHKPHLNCAIRCETKLQPFNLLRLLKDIENKLGRSADKKKWAPRIIDIAILVWDDLISQTDLLSIPHTGLLESPFALWPTADVA